MRTIFTAFILTFVFSGFIAAKAQMNQEIKVLINKQKVVKTDSSDTSKRSAE
jgi:hypothetical protein